METAGAQRSGALWGRSMIALESCTAVDTYTAKFVFKQGFPLFEYYMHFVPAMPKAYIESAGEEAFNNAPVGNGPCKFVSHELGSSVEFEAFEDYFLGKPSFDKLTLRIIPEASTLVAGPEKWGDRYGDRNSLHLRGRFGIGQQHHA